LFITTRRITMSTEKQTPDATDLEELKNRFADWRRQRKRGARVPKELWESAVGFSSTHSVSEISRTLGIDYARLKRRVETARNTPEKGKCLPATFVEVGAAELTPNADCVVEFENAKGIKVRMCFRKGRDLDFATLSKAFWRNGG
jgi:signal recognition particle subunit SEC65